MRRVPTYLLALALCNPVCNAQLEPTDAAGDFCTNRNERESHERGYKRWPTRSTNQNRW
jgi:hypothetical protein